MQNINSIQPISWQSLGLVADFAGIKLTGQTSNNQRFYISVVDSIQRILSTRLGSRVMRPYFGSDLYLLRDRSFGSEWRVRATRYIFEAIQRNEPRAQLEQVHFKLNASTGQHSFSIEISPRGSDAR